MFNLPDDDDEDTSDIEKASSKGPRASTNLASMLQSFRVPEGAETSPLSPDSVFSESRPGVCTGAGAGLGPSAAVNAGPGDRLGGLCPVPPDAAMPAGPGGRLSMEGGLSPAPLESSHRIAGGDGIHPGRVSLSTLTSSADKSSETKSYEAKAVEMNALLSSLYGTAKPAKAGPLRKSSIGCETKSRRRSLALDPDQLVNLGNGGVTPTADVGTYPSGSTDGAMWPLSGTTDGARGPLSGNTDGARSQRAYRHASISGAGPCTSESGASPKGCTSESGTLPKGYERRRRVSICLPPGESYSADGAGFGAADSLQLSSITVTGGPATSPSRAYPSPPSFHLQPSSPGGAGGVDVAPTDSPTRVFGGLVSRLSRLMSSSGPKPPEVGPEDPVQVSPNSGRAMDHVGIDPSSPGLGSNTRRSRRFSVTEGFGGGALPGQQYVWKYAC
eukprot:gene30119-35095_t